MKTRIRYFNISGSDLDITYRNGRLLTDKIQLPYQDPISLRYLGLCKNHDDVIRFFKKNFNCDKKIKYSSMIYKNKSNIEALVKIKLSNDQIKAIIGTMYWGNFKIEFNRGIVSFTYRGIYYYGADRVTGKFDVLRAIGKRLDRFSQVDFLNSLKKLVEQ